MKVHFLGIGGSGASAAAAVAKAQGFEISGCDLNPDNEFTTHFDKEILFKGHSPVHLYRHPELVSGSDEMPKQVRHDNLVNLLIITPAILSLDPNNKELIEAKRLSIPTLTWQEFLGEYLTKQKFVIAVCGTHGKSTTTAMIGCLLEDAGLAPTVILGAIVPKWKTNFRLGKSKYFVVEADEFNDNFLPTKPDIAVVTNIEMDHPEYFKNFEDYQESFKKFLSQTKQKIFANMSDRKVRDVILANEVRPESSKSENPSSLDSGQAGMTDKNNVVSKIIDYSKQRIDFPLKVPGGFNRLNASAAFQVGLALGIDPTLIRNSLMGFTSIGRRFEYLGKLNKADVYSDFAHHPTEIKVTIEALKQKFPNKKIWIIFQPHMFSRTLSLFSEFVEVFKNLEVDQVSLVDIYPSREVDNKQVSSKQLVEAIDKKNVSYIGSIEGAEKFIPAASGKFEIIFFVGAGDIDQMARRMIYE